MSLPTITIVDTGTSKADGQGGIDIVTGSPTAHSSVSSLITGANQAAVTISGVWTGRLQFEASSDGGISYNPVDAVVKGIDEIVQQVTKNGTFLINGAANQTLRVRAVGAMTGAAAVGIVATTTQNFQTVVPVKNTENGALLAIAAVAAGTFVSDDQTNEGNNAITAILDITAGATFSTVFTIEGKDPASGKYFTLLASAAKVAVATTVLQVGPGLPATANVSANANLPKTWRLKAVVADNAGTASMTATVGAALN